MAAQGTDGAGDVLDRHERLATRGHAQLALDKDAWIVRQERLLVAPRELLDVLCARLRARFAAGC
jgi:hypothetical protein